MVMVAAGSSQRPSAPWTHVTSFAIGDMNRDGRPDLVYAGFNDARDYVLQIAPGRGNGTFVMPSTAVPLPTRASAVALADVNRDGKLDAIALLSPVTNVPTEARVWFGNGAAGLAATSWAVSFINSYGVQFDVGDVNHDGYLDIIASDHEQMAVALGSPTGFAGPVFTAVPTGQFLGAISIGDVNVDGNPDVAFGSGDVMFGNGDSTFVSGGRFDYGPFAGVRIVEFTRDGLPDIVATSDRGVMVLANSATPPTCRRA